MRRLLPLLGLSLWAATARADVPAPFFTDDCASATDGRCCRKRYVEVYPQIDDDAGLGFCQPIACACPASWGNPEHGAGHNGDYTQFAVDGGICCAQRTYYPDGGQYYPSGLLDGGLPCDIALPTTCADCAVSDPAALACTPDSGSASTSSSSTSSGGTTGSSGGTSSSSGGATGSSGSTPGSQTKGGCQSGSWAGPWLLALVVPLVMRRHRPRR
jgi:hypothetical protein